MIASTTKAPSERVPPAGTARRRRHAGFGSWRGVLGGTFVMVAAVVGGARPIDPALAPAVLVRQAALTSPHVMQSFAFDPRNGEIYAVQVEQTDALGTWSQHAARGDLDLTRLSADGTHRLGHMRLEGFGHGVSIGVEPDPADSDAVWLWTEVDSKPNGDGEGRGTRLGRFRFQNGETLACTDTSIAKYSPVATALQVTPSINATEGLLAARYLSRAGEFRLAVFRLADVARRHFAPLRDIALPTHLGVFQGYAIASGRVYLLTGTAYGPRNPPPGNTRLHVVDDRTGALIQSVPLRVFGEDGWREPEGMAIHVTPDTPPRLCFGFSSYASARGGWKYISIASYPVGQDFSPMAPPQGLTSHP